MVSWHTSRTSFPNTAFPGRKRCYAEPVATRTSADDTHGLYGLLDTFLAAEVEAAAEEARAAV
jgi:hypothetical protein